MPKACCRPRSDPDRLSQVFSKRALLKTAFLTGASGFVGSHTAGLLLKRGWRVKALVRDPSRPGLLPTGVEVVMGGLADATQYRPALAGCDAVIHLAGLVKARKLSEYLTANADGSEALASAAAGACPGSMFVHVSSQAAAGPAWDGQPVTESDEPRPVSWYGQSKLEGERRVERRYPGPWCVVRPGVVYGPGDPGLLELFKTVQSGFAPIVAGGRCRVQLVAVEDLAAMLVAAATRPDLAGRRGFAASHAVSMRDLIGFIADLRQPPARRVPVPGWAVRLAGLWESARQRVTGEARPFNLDKAREMLQPDWLCDAKPFVDALGVPDPRPWQEGLRALCRCYVDGSRLRPTVWAV